MIVHAGVDISARWFDICVLHGEKPKHRQFENSKSGLSQCIKWLEGLGVKELEIALEPTGRYGELVAEYFRARKCKVFQVNTLKFSRFAESLDIRGKSDPKDSQGLAVYLRERRHQLHEWKPKTELELELRDMQVLFRGITKRLVAIQCQLQCRLYSEYVTESLSEEAEQLEATLQEALNRAERLVLSHEVLSKDYELLCTIPGIGRQSALLLITIVDFRKFRTSRALACFLGLTKRQHQSGSSIRGHEGISKRGNKWLRGALFMPARSARRHNPLVQEFSERQLSMGKHDWCIQMAVVRKLVTTAWALVVNQVPFDPMHKNPSTAPT